MFVLCTLGISLDSLLFVKTLRTQLLVEHYCHRNGIEKKDWEQIHALSSERHFSQMEDA